MAGIGEPSSTILPKEHWAQDPATANYYNHDIGKAKKLLAEAGYPNGIDIDAYGWADQVAMQRQELIISQWAQAGIRIKLTPVAPQTAIQLFMLEKKGAMFISPAGGFPDPSQYYEVLFGKDALRNAGKVELPGFRELLDATMEVDDRAARKAAFAKLQRFVVEQALQAPQYVMFGVTVRSKQVRNYVDGLLTTPKFHQVWLETGSG
jgi:peptide/nickel transport system substrate-binding protein/glutathione transport system substrate-binding protein